jgi:hypothetical protein
LGELGFRFFRGSEVPGILLGAPEGSDFWREIHLRDGKATVESYRLKRGFNREMARASIEQWKQRFPEARLRSFSTRYNCVGMVFASRRAWIESTEFSVDLNVVSSLASFVNALRSEKAIHLLVREMKSGPLWGEVCRRILHLLKSPFDPGYENPHDTALAAYALSSYWYNAAAGRVAARWVGTAKNTWWAARVSSLILSQQAGPTPRLQMRTLFPGPEKRPPLHLPPVHQTFVWHPLPKDVAFTIAAKPPAPVNAFKVSKMERPPRRPPLVYQKNWMKEAA